jgi:hypothetical protein
MDLAPMPDGTLRRRALRDALAAECASVASRDALAALSHVTVPVLVVHANAPLPQWGGVEMPWAAEPYIDPRTVNAQVDAAGDARLYLSDGQNHADLVTRPSAGAIEAMRTFAEEVRKRSGAAVDAAPIA